MNRWLASATLLATLGLQSAATAGPADPRFSSVDPVLLSSRSGTVNFHVTVRNVSNAPEGHEELKIDFSGAGIRVRMDAVQQSGVTVDCIGHSVSLLTDAGGQANLALGFGGFANEALVEVNAGGVVLRTIPARSTDFDADATTGLPDLTVFARDFLAEPNAHPEADFDGSGGAVGLGDLVAFAGDYLSGAHGGWCP